LSGSRFVYVSYIRVTPEKLWQALTRPEIIAQYRFGMNVESDWNVGSAWKMYADGHLMDAGEILESVAPQRLVLSWRSEWSAAFKAEGNSTCVFEIEPTGPIFEAHTHAFERTAELQVHRSRRGGLADGHLESQVAARNRGGGSGLSAPARRLNKARQLISPPRLVALLRIRR